MPAELILQYQKRIAELETALAEAQAAADESRPLADLQSHGELPVDFALAAANIGLFNVDVASQTVHVTPGFCRIFGLKVQSSFPATTLEAMVLVNSDAIEGVSTARSRRDGSAAQVVEYQIARADDGEHRRIERRAKVRRDEQGEVVDFGGVVQDITSARQASEVIAQAQQALSEFSAGREFVISLTAQQRELTQPDKVMRLTARLLGERLGAHRVAFYRVLTASTLQYINGWNDDPLPALSGIFPTDKFGSGAAVLRAGGTVLSFTDSRHDHGGHLTGLAEQGVLSGVEVPLLTKQRWHAGMVVHGASVRSWTQAEVGLIQEVAQLAWLAVERAEAFTRLGNRIEFQELKIENQLQESKVEKDGRLLAEEKVRQLQKLEAVGQLTGGIAHDFNNMLAVIVGSLALMQRKVTRGEAKIAHHIESAMDGARRAATLTSRLLAFSRQHPMAPEATDLNRLVADLSDLLTRTLGETVHFEIIQSAGLWVTRVDPHQLESVLMNLCVNARDAMPKGGKLTIETSNVHVEQAYALEFDLPVGHYVVLSVTDSGEGMTLEVQARVFEPFFTTKAVGKGTGLGLSQAFGFASQSGGQLKVYSEVGHGTTFKLYLPRHWGAVDRTSRRTAQGTTRKGRVEEIILLVEDDDRLRVIASETLRDLGYTVLHAANGAEALAMIDAGQDAVLLFTDVVMPGMTGRELADKALERLPHLKVLYTTGYTRNAVVHNGVIDLGTHFLAKPFTIEALASKVAEVLDEPKVERTIETIPKAAA
ncbi:ATP-binding protein [Variovorax sp. RHLX14]|uniref:ATP-binding protein n=1 Tax=Variovorax sp. RHLX14 TaxID=1259731 RepID=UPI003F482FB7